MSELITNEQLAQCDKAYKAHDDQVIASRWPAIAARLREAERLLFNAVYHISSGEHAMPDAREREISAIDAYFKRVNGESTHADE